MSTSTPSQTSAAQPAGAIRLGRIAGVPVLLSNNWVTGLVLLVVLYGSSLLGTGRSLTSIGVLSLAMVAMLALSVVLHEGTHAVVARAVGYQVESVTLTLWGGYTATTPLRPTPLRSGLVSVSGPLSNLVLAGLAFVLRDAIPVDTAQVLLTLLYWMNLFLGIFNILPGLPMDGGGVVEAAVWAATGSRSRGQLVAGWCGRVIAVGVALWYLRPLLGGQQFDLGNVWMLFVAAMLWLGASRAIAGSRSRGVLDALTVAQTSLPGFLVPAQVVLGEALQQAGSATAILVDAGQVVGVVPPRQVDDPDLLQVPATRFALPCPPVPLDVTPEMPVAEIAARMQAQHMDILVGRYPTGEPRVITAALVVNALRDRAAA